MGHRPPYLAVVSISLMAATVWRQLRGRLADKGITDPLQQFPHLHALLDFAEAVWMESLHTGDEAKDKIAKDRYNQALYGPETPPAPRTSQGGRKRPRQAPPPGWGDQASRERQFDQVATQLTGARARGRL